MTKQEVIQKLFIAKYGKEEIIINFGNQSTATDTVTLVNRFMLPLGQCKEIQFGSDVDKANGFKFELVNIKSNKQNFRLIFTDSLQTQKFTVAHSSMTGDQITDTVDLRTNINKKSKKYHGSRIKTPRLYILHQSCYDLD